MYLNIIKAIYNNHTEWNKAEAFWLGSIMRQQCSFTTPLFNTVLKVLAHAIRQEEEMQDTQIGQEYVKLSLFRRPMD
jgi:hypothetical protein